MTLLDADWQAEYGRIPTITWWSPREGAKHLQQLETAMADLNIRELTAKVPLRPYRPQAKVRCRGSEVDWESVSDRINGRPTRRMNRATRAEVARFWLYVAHRLPSDIRADLSMSVAEYNRVREAA
jgi:hypothetical protein